jgi:predicted ATPase
MLRRIRVEGYRSIRSLDFELGQVTVIVGENGTGKSNLYRALSLLREAATGGLAPAIAREGGMKSVLWAGETQKNTARAVSLSVDLDDLRYALKLGLPGPTDPALALDPVVKEEAISVDIGGKHPVMLQRKGPSVISRDAQGEWQPYQNMLLMAETALGMLRDPKRFPELDRIQRALSGWRFHHAFRTDADSPIRQPQGAVCSPVLDADGSNLAAVLATVLHLKDGAQDYARSEVAQAIEAAFPGAALQFDEAAGRHTVALRTADFRRAFAAHEMSDGTLRYLCLVGALCSYRRPNFIALNEPEASLHTDLIGPLAKMILRTAEDTQMIVVTHSSALADRLEVEGAATRIGLEKRGGETVISARGSGAGAWT